MDVLLSAIARCNDIDSHRAATVLYQKVSCFTKAGQKVCGLRNCHPVMMTSRLMCSHGTDCQATTSVALLSFDPFFILRAGLLPSNDANMAEVCAVLFVKHQIWGTLTMQVIHFAARTRVKLAAVTIVSFIANSHFTKVAHCAAHQTLCRHGVFRCSGFSHFVQVQ